MSDKFFMMSMRFNKKTYNEFGLILSGEPDVYVMTSDNSLWKKRQLYDFGWGRENGFYRLPLFGFNQLVELLLKSDIDDNKYGAAAVILDDYCEDLFVKSNEILNDKNRKQNYFDFFKILKLDQPMNRSYILGKSFKEISKDFEKWKELSIKVQDYLNNETLRVRE